MIELHHERGERTPTIKARDTAEPREQLNLLGGSPLPEQLVGHRPDRPCRRARRREGHACRLVLEHAGPTLVSVRAPEFTARVGRMVWPPAPGWKRQKRLAVNAITARL
jgi:hypothetical protein